jgi:hypothetical protein
VADTNKRLGAHLRNKPQDITHQTRISKEPALPCKQGCGREASTSRKDKLCDNCGTIADTHGVKHQ